MRNLTLIKFCFESRKFNPLVEELNGIYNKTRPQSSISEQALHKERFDILFFFTLILLVNQEEKWATIFLCFLLFNYFGGSAV